ncbi:hypothetical protein QP027_08200 [Corynebacterium breve]|uniref:Uncharacterized protein n=1 Tax=Corynebacterium breve TaxID=3049799 RepID=A0ABY8VBQ8_9CORY|nr:hypothetical protein [Corynebacterium breve]WIM67104.1 hypothetical protein QP027_08200 [Corynebacterium breve]
MGELLVDLTQASIWIQLPVMLLVIMPLAGVGAVLLLSAIDRLGALFGKLKKKQ